MSSPIEGPDYLLSICILFSRLISNISGCKQHSAWQGLEYPLSWVHFHRCELMEMWEIDSDVAYAYLGDSILAAS